MASLIAAATLLTYTSIKSARSKRAAKKRSRADARIDQLKQWEEDEGREEKLAGSRDDGSTRRRRSSEEVLVGSSEERGAGGGGGGGVVKVKVGGARDFDEAGVGRGRGRVSEEEVEEERGGY